MPRYLDRTREEADTGYQFELGTWSIVAMLCSVAVLCGMFFAIGYTFGKHAIPADFTLGNQVVPASAAQASIDKPSPSTTLPVNPAAAGNKLAVSPGANSPVANSSSSASFAAPPNANGLSKAEQNKVSTTLQPSATGATSANSAQLPSEPPLSGAQTPKPNPNIPGDVPVGSKPPVQIPGAANFAVQVFAGVNRSDAENLAAALKARQYPVYVLLPDPAIGQQYYRVQVGPFPTQQQAQEMQSRLKADGYNAILKP